MAQAAADEDKRAKRTTADKVQREHWSRPESTAARMCQLEDFPYHQRC